MDDLDQLLEEMERGDRDATHALHITHANCTSAEDVTMEQVGSNDPWNDGLDGDATLNPGQLDSLLHTIRELEHQLKQTSTSSSAHAATLQVASSAKHQAYAQQKQLFQIRKSLRSAYIRYIHADLVSAAALDFETALWKNSIYKQIESLRKLLKQCTPQPTSKKVAQQWTRYHQFLTLTRSFLRECMRLYDSLFLKHLAHTDFEAIPVERKRKREEVDGGEDADGDAKMADTDASPPAATSASSSSSLRLPHIVIRPRTFAPSSSTSLVVLPHETRQLYLLSAHRCLICRGDLERYAHLIEQEEHAQRAKKPGGMEEVASNSLPTTTTPFQPNWSRVERFYFLAISLEPELGNPWNQLAVIATYKHDTLLAVYRYFRALSSVQPFPTAEVNLKLLVENTIDSTVYASHQPKHALNATLSTPVFPGIHVCAHFMLTPWLDFAWVHLFHLLSTASHAQLQSALPCVANAVLARFSQQMKAKASFKLEFGLRLLLNFIYCIHLPAPSASQQQVGTGSAIASSSISQQDVHQSMYDDSSTTPARHQQPLPPIIASHAAFNICCEYLSLLMTTLHAGSAPLIGVLNTFLRWLQLHPGQLTKLSSLPKTVRQAFLHNLAQLANVALAHLAASKPVVPSPAVAIVPSTLGLLYEEEETLGVSFLSDSLSNGDPSLMNVVEDEPVETEPMEEDIRRCKRLIELAQWMASTNAGMVRDTVLNGGRFRSTLSEDTARTIQPTPNAAFSPANGTSPAATNKPAAVVPVPGVAQSNGVNRPAVAPAAPIQLAISTTSAGVVGAQLAHAFTSSFDAAAAARSHHGTRVSVPSTAPTSAILRSNRPPPGFAPLPADARGR